MRPRAGVLLVEALCALALAGLLAAAAALALGAARRAVTAVDGVVSTDRAGREAVAIAAALLRDADSLALRGDTAVDLPLRIAHGVVCATEAQAIWLPPVRVPGGRPFTARAQPIEPGDLVTMLLVDSLATGMRWEGPLVIDSIAERSGSPGCDPTDGWVPATAAGEPRLRLALSAPLAPGLRAGAAVRIARRGRLALYRSGAEWMLGWRRCASDGMTCGAIQPVAGPLRTPGGGGFRVRRAADDLVTVEARGLPPARTTQRTVPRDAWP